MSEASISADDLLPLSDMGYHLLVALGDDVLHGYALGQRLSELSGGRLRPTTGALYQVIRRYLKSGILVRAEAPEGMDGDARRQFFTVTSLGRKVRSLETARLTALIGRAQALDGG